MKWLVAPNESQRLFGPGHFTWTTPGEVLVPGSKCSRGEPNDNCGCCRSMSGLDSRKVTTTGVVAEVDLTIEQIAKRDVVRFCQDQADAEALKKMVSSQCLDYAEVVELLKDFNVGDVVSFAFELVGGDHELFINKRR